jgi:6-phosphogluconolactonase
VPKPPELHVVDDPASVVGDLLAEQARRGGTIVLTGGSTPGRAYEHAAGAEPDWSRVSLWWGDERCVPPDDDRSNYKLARDTLLARLTVQPDAHRIEGELAPEEAARRYDAQITGVELDLLLLGVGPDGHMASLFPGSPQLDVTDVSVTSGPPGLEPLVDRVTLTLPAIQGAKRIVFLVSGESKAEAVERAFLGDITPSVPSSLARLAPAGVEIFLDPPAASRMNST